MTTAYKEGVEARAARRALKDCPYENGAERVSWQKGYMACKATQMYSNYYVSPTGRVVCNQPNLQQILTGSEEAKRLAEALRAVFKEKP